MQQEECPLWMEQQFNLDHFDDVFIYHNGDKKLIGVGSSHAWSDGPDTYEYQWYDFDTGKHIPIDIVPVEKKKCLRKAKQTCPIRATDMWWHKDLGKHVFSRDSSSMDGPIEYFDKSGTLLFSRPPAGWGPKPSKKKENEIEKWESSLTYVGRCHSSS